MREKFLPVGTVVLLKGATKRLVISGYCAAQPEDPNIVYDYVAALFPEANLAGDEVALFNHDQIGTIVHMGLDDDEFKLLDKSIKDALASEDTPTDFNNLDISHLPPFTPENINNILEQINKQGDALKPIKEPSAFDSEVIKQPTFELPTLGGSDDKKKEEKEKKEKVTTIINDEDDIPVDSSVLLDDEANGQPVLQLQPVFPEGGDTGESAAAAATIPGLTRL